MIVRTASVEDSAGIARAHVTSWQEAYRDIIPQAYLDGLSIKERGKEWIRILNKGESETLVAVHSDEVLGFVSVGKRRDGPVMPDMGEIYGIYVVPQHWYTGVGKSLCAAAFGRLRDLGFARIAVWVLSRNDRARQFYQRLGFTCAEDSKNTVDIGGRTLFEARYEITL